VSNRDVVDSASMKRTLPKESNESIENRVCPRFNWWLGGVTRMVQVWIIAKTKNAQKVAEVQQ